MQLPNKREIEGKAIVAARQNLCKALTDIGVIQSFNSCSGEQIDYVIEAVIAGFSEYVRKHDDTIPF